MDVDDYETFKNSKINYEKDTINIIIMTMIKSRL